MADCFDFICGVFLFFRRRYGAGAQDAVERYFFFLDDDLSGRSSAFPFGGLFGMDGISYSSEMGSHHIADVCAAVRGFASLRPDYHVLRRGT